MSAQLYSVKYYQANREKRLVYEYEKRRARVEAGKCRDCGELREYGFLGVRCLKCHAKTTSKQQGIKVTREMLEELLLEQVFSCGACTKPFNETPHVDHCHETGKVRGLLCRWCNSTLAHAKDDIQRLENLIQYLQEATDEFVS